jgi:hypothetical protein
MLTKAVDVVAADGTKRTVTVRELTVSEVYEPQKEQSKLDLVRRCCVQKTDLGGLPMSALRVLERAILDLTNGTEASRGN